MSTTYSVISGDTFEAISRKVYGTENGAVRISSANPGVSEPLVTGTVLVTPPDQSAPQNKPQSGVADNEDEVSVLLDGTRFRFWESIQIKRSLDSMDTMTFSAPFEPSEQSFRETFRPFTYKTAMITVGGETLFTGIMVNITPFLENSRSTIEVSAYSTPGVLNDCTPPASSYPVEFNEQGLEEIARTMALPFGIDVNFIDDQGATFERVAAGVTKKVLSFLTSLARQRNLVISSDSDGILVFQKSVSVGSPVAILTQGESPLLSVSPAFKPQEYYSHVTGIDPVLLGLDGSQFTVKNTRLEGVVRPITFKSPDNKGTSVKASTEAKAGRMFANIASYNVQVSTWRDPSGKLWEPNTTIKLIAPSAMIYTEYEFIIRKVELSAEPNSRTASLELVLPGSFSGEIPEAMPWDE